MSADSPEENSKKGKFAFAGHEHPDPGLLHLLF
jgi:hypothetical protein